MLVGSGMAGMMMSLSKGQLDIALNSCTARYVPDFYGCVSVVMMARRLKLPGDMLIKQLLLLTIFQVHLARVVTL